MDLLGEIKKKRKQKRSEPRYIEEEIETIGGLPVWAQRTEEKYAKGTALRRTLKRHEIVACGHAVSPENYAGRCLVCGLPFCKDCVVQMPMAYTKICFNDYEKLRSRVYYRMMRELEATRNPSKHVRIMDDYAEILGRRKLTKEERDSLKFSLLLSLPLRLLADSIFGRKSKAKSLPLPIGEVYRIDSLIDGLLARVRQERSLNKIYGG
jgi:hypothetical protein